MKLEKYCETNNDPEISTVFDSLNLKLENIVLLIDSKQIKGAIKRIVEMNEVEKDLKRNI